MKLSERINQKWLLALTMVFCLSMFNQAQSTEVDTLSKAKEVTEQCTEAKSALPQVKNKKVKKVKTDKKQTKDSIEISKCFEHGFLYKKNAISSI
ncbi:hypothetical protein [Carboxylicivirga sp. N1Y90]|uniref:hypothetical protein n=1 Tax=Carboxylicivirga fragile TaxID=3417571 RepID=UPI003D3491D1|nr:hypothetical protein [Marinilabiliaceae bacterium N1Y90]